MGVADLPVEAFHSIKTKIDETNNQRSSLASLADQSNEALTSTVSLPVTKVEQEKHSHHFHLPSRSATGTPKEEITTPPLSPTSGSTTEESSSSPLVETVSEDSSIESKISQSSHCNMEAGGKGRIREREAVHAVEAILKVPMDFSASIAQGFHNAPKLYGDHTVRRAETITDVKSGMKAAGKDLALGFYDGVTGLVTHPIREAKEHGVAGLISGVVKGVGGLVLKPTAGTTLSYPQRLGSLLTLYSHYFCAYGRDYRHLQATRKINRLLPTNTYFDQQGSTRSRRSSRTDGRR